MLAGDNNKHHILTSSLTSATNQVPVHGQRSPIKMLRLEQVADLDVLKSISDGCHEG